MNLNQLTADKMLRFLYDEMAEEESIDFLSSLKNNATQMQDFLELQETIESLNTIN
jgi:hypothetical protein